MTEEEIASHIVGRLDTMDDPAMVEAYRRHPRVVEAIAHWDRTNPAWGLTIRSAFFGRLELLRDETRIRPSGMTSKPEPRGRVVPQRQSYRKIKRPDRKK